MEAVSVEEVLAKSSGGKDANFDEIIGNIEDLLIDDKFNKLQNDFKTKYYQQFEDVEENKLEYTSIFKEYQDLIEHHLEKELSKRLPQFSMTAFIKQLMERKEELDGEVFEMLLSLSDFLIFKELMLDFKKEKEGTQLDLTDDIVITSLASLNVK